MLRYRLISQNQLLYVSRRAFQNMQYDPKNDYYAILGVNQKDSSKQIKAAFYKLAQKYHPDKNPGHEEKFKAMSSAYEVVGNEETRKQYDQLKEQHFSPRRKAEPHPDSQARKRAQSYGYNPGG